MKLEQIKPEDIERRSFQLIDEILQKEYPEYMIPEEEVPITKRVIHTTADFGYLDTLCYVNNAIEKGKEALEQGACIITDTQMAQAGINKKAVERLGGQVHCFMADEDVAAMAKKNNTTRAIASMDKAAQLQEQLIFAIGNAPTALIRLYELIQERKIQPALVIGVPVGFVNVVQAKELLLSLSVPAIVARGRKGGSNVAAAICNGLLYELVKR